MLSEEGDGRLQFAGTVDGTGVQLGEVEAVALVEAKRVEVVIGGHQPQLVRAGAGGEGGDRLDQVATDAAATPRAYYRERGELGRAERGTTARLDLPSGRS